MTGDEKKENRWAKVLDDAGLLDDVDDAWELPVGEKLSDGATIEVRSSVVSPQKATIVEHSASLKNTAREDETQKVITVLGSDSPAGKEEDTVRVSYKGKNAQSSDEPLLTQDRDRISKMPFTPVTNSGNSRHSPPDFVPRTETDPGEFAKHSMATSAGNEQQPQYAVTVDDNIGWDALMDEDERPTVEVPSYSQHSSEQGAEALVWDQADETPSAQNGDSALENGAAQTPSLVDAVARMQGTAEPHENDQFAKVRGARISVQINHAEPVDSGRTTGSIVDNPISEAPEPIELAPPSLQVQMAEKYELGDFSGALDIAEQLLERDTNNFDAVQYRKSCRDRLLKMYESRIGDMDHVPMLLVSEHELMWRNLDASIGFLLSRIDGISSYENILDISGMPKFETCRILDQLLCDGLIR